MNFYPESRTSASLPFPGPEALLLGVMCRHDEFVPDVHVYEDQDSEHSPFLPGHLLIPALTVFSPGADIPVVRDQVRVAAVGPTLLVREIPGGKKTSTISVSVSSVSDLLWVNVHKYVNGAWRRAIHRNEGQVPVV